MFDDFNDENDTDTTDTDTGDLTLDEINSLGQHPDLMSVSAEFARTIQGLDWPLRKTLDELFGRAVLEGLEVGHAAGRFSVSVALRF